MIMPTRVQTLAVLFCLAGCAHACAQSILNVEKYTSLESGKQLSVMPIVSFETRNKWQAQARYNYEEAQTASLHMGRTFSTQGNVIFHFTPLLGIVAGKLNGLSAGLNTEAECGNFFGSASFQYVRSHRYKEQNFFYNWSEAGYNISDRVYAGLSLQYTGQQGDDYVEPGILAGLNFKNVSFPCYVFNLLRPDTYVVMGISFSIQ